MLSEHDIIAGALTVFLGYYGPHKCSEMTGWSDTNLRAGANGQIAYYSQHMLEELARLLPVPAMSRGGGSSQPRYDREDIVMALEAAARSLRPKNPR